MKPWNLLRGSALRAVLLLAACSIAAPAAQAQPYPSKPVRIIVPFPPGGGTDLAARLVGPKLAERLGQPFIVENRVGAGGAIAWDMIAKSAPDGYTIGVGTSGMAVNVTLQPKLPFHPLNSFEPIIKWANNPLVLISHPSFSSKNVRGLVKLAKAQPGKISYGSPGVGSAMHMAGALLNQTAGIEIVHVAYKGNGPMVNDVLGGQIPIAFGDLASTLKFIQAGKLHAIGMAARTRSSLAPKIPTLAETGVPGFDVPSWTGLLAPAKTPRAIVHLLNANVKSILETPEIRQRFLLVGLEPTSTTPEEVAAIVRSDIAMWAKLITDAGIKPVN